MKRKLLRLRDFVRLERIKRNEFLIMIKKIVPNIAPCKYITVRNISYKVYEISEECRLRGRLLKTFKSKEAAIRFMEQSIYRYIKEVPNIYECRL